MKKIMPDWIIRTAEEVERVKDIKGYESNGKMINLTDPSYQNLYQQYCAGTLDEASEEAFEEIEYLRDVINVATARLAEKSAAPKVEAATKPLPGNPEVEAPEEEEEEEEEEKVEKVEEVPPTPPSGQVLPSRERKLLPGPTEPDTTKWKEIRFNKRAGMWQVVVTTRTVRSYETEEEALNAAKKV